MERETFKPTFVDYYFDIDNLKKEFAQYEELHEDLEISTDSDNSNISKTKIKFTKNMNMASSALNKQYKVMNNINSMMSSAYSFSNSSNLNISNTTSLNNCGNILDGIDNFDPLFNHKLGIAGYVSHREIDEEEELEYAEY